MKVRPYLLFFIFICLLSLSPVPLYAGDNRGSSNNGNNGNHGNGNNNGHNDDDDDDHRGNNGNNGNNNNNNGNNNNGNGNGNGWSWNNTNVAWHHQNGDHQYCNHGNHQQAPFDGGFTLLAGAGLAYGIKRARDKRKKILSQR